MPRIARRYAPFAYGVIQSAITTAVATAIATYQLSGDSMSLLKQWLGCWGLSWLTMLPVVILISPAIQRAVVSMTRSDDASAGSAGR